MHLSIRRRGERLLSRVRYIVHSHRSLDSDYLRLFLQDLSESAAAAKRKQKILYDNLGTTKNKAKL